MGKTVIAVASISTHRPSGIHTYTPFLARPTEFCLFHPVRPYTSMDSLISPMQEPLGGLGRETLGGRRTPSKNIIQGVCCPLLLIWKVRYRITDGN